MAMTTRRRFLSLLGAAPAAALVPGVAHAGGAKVLMIGSSMMAGGFGLYLGQQLEAAHGCVVERRTKVSSGLARPDFHDWIANGAAAREEVQPDIVVCMFGGNDGQGLWMGPDQEPPWYRYGEPGWVPEYRRRVNQFADAVAPERERLFWIGMLQVRGDKLHERVAVMNTIYESEMAIRPNARYISTWDELTVNGKYSDKIMVDGSRMRVRAGDGVHVSPTGAHVLADFIQPFIAEEV